MPVRVPILMYHSVSDQANSSFKEFTVSPRLFGEQMAYLKRQHYTTFTVSEFARAMKRGYLPGERPVLLTFDDGFADFTSALPVLRHYNFAATLYVTTAFVGGASRWLKNEGQGDRPMLTWDQLREISAGGIECGAHGHTHAPLDRMSRQAAHDEITRSKRLLEENLVRPISSFAYPYGYYSVSVQDLVRRAGYASACAVRYRPSSVDDDQFALARLMITANTSMPDFARLVAGPGLPVQQTFKQVRASIWKLVRSAIPTRSSPFPAEMETS